MGFTVRQGLTEPSPSELVSGLQGKEQRWHPSFALS